MVEESFIGHTDTTDEKDDNIKYFTCDLKKGVYTISKWLSSFLMADKI